MNDQIRTRVDYWALVVYQDVPITFSVTADERTLTQSAYSRYNFTLPARSSSNGNIYLARQMKVKWDSLDMLITFEFACRINRLKALASPVQSSVSLTQVQASVSLAAYAVSACWRVLSQTCRKEKKKRGLSVRQTSIRSRRALRPVCEPHERHHILCSVTAAEHGWNAGLACSRDRHLQKW